LRQESLKRQRLLVSKHFGAIRVHSNVRRVSTTCNAALAVEMAGIGLTYGALISHFLIKPLPSNGFKQEGWTKLA